MNNNQQCPICRSPLNTPTCKKCGYQEKKLKIVDTQQQFGKINYFNKIQGTRSVNKEEHKISSEEKLKIYLKQYVKLLKTATNKLSTAHSLTHQKYQQLHFHVMNIWKTYIIKRKQMKLTLAGMFKRYIATQSQQKITDNKKREAVEQSNPINSSQKQSDSSQEQVIEGKKRKATSNTRKNQSAKSILSLTTKFRSYYNVTVKPLITHSIQQRKSNNYQMTSCQKSFLSYLLAIQQQISSDFLSICSLKYLKLLLRLKGRSNEKSFVKEEYISNELKIRNSGCLKKRQDSVLLVLVIDLLYCFNSQNIHINYQSNLKDLLEIYQKSQINSKIIDEIVKVFNKDTTKQKSNVPEINYELIYTIINLGSLKLGLCLTIPQIVIGCEKLQISKIIINDDISVEGVPNQQAITSTKIRKCTHLLASFLLYTPVFYIQKWCSKLCRKLGLQNQCTKISSINRLLFKEMQLAQCKVQSRGFYYSQQGKMIKYHRHLWLEQDIACLTAILIFLKLSTGLTQYPYLINFPIKQITSLPNISNSQIHIVQSLLKYGEIKVENKLVKLVKRLFLPQLYKKQVCLLSISRHLVTLSQKDRYFNIQSFNKSFIRHRNLNHLNGVGLNDLIYTLSLAKKYQFQDKDYQIQIKYDQHQHKQFTRQIADRYKKAKMKKINKQALRTTQELSNNLIRQVSCIVSKNQVMISEGNLTINQQCRIDQPSTNYQIMYEYSQENLALSKRLQQLYFMELLCLNICSFSELSNWLLRYENILKHFEV